MKAWLAALLERGVQFWVDGGDVCYRAPTGIVTPEVREEIAAHKAALLNFLGTGQKWAPASFAQQRLWFLDRYDDDHDVYVLPSFAMRLRGSLNVDALTRAWAATVQRHEPLRTVFREVDGRPAQVVLATGVALQREAIRGDGERDEQARAFVGEKASRRFDLAEGPLAQAWLGAFDASDHVFCVPMHHIITDGLSMDVLLRDLAGFYNRACAGETCDASPPRTTYADYACAQRAVLTGPRLDALSDFWREQLVDLPPLLELPTDHPRPARQTFDGDAVQFELSPHTTAGVQSLAGAARTTPLIILFAAYSAVLQRWSGQSQFAVGMPAAGRVHPALAELVGFFVNTLPIAVDFGEIGFTDLISHIDETVSRSLAHQDLPFERLVEAVQPPRKLYHSPLFQVQFVQEPMPRAVAFDGLDATGVVIPTVKTKYDLGLFVRIEGERIHGRLEFNTALFDKATAARFVEQFMHVLNAAFGNPECPVSELPLGPSADAGRIAGPEKAEITRQFASVSQAFADAAAQHPERTAVICGDGEWTYADLAARVERWAAGLRARGVTRGRCVGIALPRSAEAIAAMLAIMRAGGAYVVLDAELPAARLAAIVEDANIQILIGDKTACPPIPGVEIVETQQLAIASHASLGDWPGGEDAAYVLFTSGSTGTPKGVVVEHRNLAHYVDAVSRRLQLLDDASYASVTTLAADLGHTAIFPALCNGGALHLVMPEIATSAAQFAAYRDRRPYDCLKIVPSHLAALMDGQHGARILPRKVLVLGGERCPWELVERIHALRPDLRVINHYGPTETTVGALTHEIDFDTPRAGASVPIGRPLPRMYARVLDARRRPTPAGVPGELYLGGAGVARGYLNREDDTAKAFVSDAEQVGERMYRTGDRVRFLANGAVEFLGRIDDQVKIRGFRVEPGEVAAQLRGHPAVSDAAVVVVHDAYGDAQLAAYAAAAPDLDDVEVRQFLRGRIPAYMVPETITVVAHLPITANGKLDRAALPPAKAARAEGNDGSAQLPRTDTERKVAAVWEDLLRRESIGAHENFLELGGHSLLAIRVVSRLNEAFDVDLPLAVMFETPTVAGVAARVEGLRNGLAHEDEAAETRASKAHRLVVTIRAGGNLPALFCIAPAGGTTFPYYALAHHLPAGRPVYGLLDPAFDDSQPPCGSIEEQAAAYVSAIRAAQPDAPYHVAGWSFGGVVAYEVARQLAAMGAGVGLVSLIEAYAPRARNAFRLRDLAPNLAFLTGFAASGLETVRDSLFLMAAPTRANGHGGIARAWWGGLYRLYLRRAGMAAVVEENQALLSLDQPSTRRFIRIARANLKAGQSYRGGEYGGPLTVFKARVQPTAAAAEGALGWEEMVEASAVALHEIEGDHFNVLRNPNVVPLAQLMGEAMADCENAVAVSPNRR